MNKNQQPESDPKRRSAFLPACPHCGKAFLQQILDQDALMKFLRQHARECPRQPYRDDLAKAMDQNRRLIEENATLSMVNKKAEEDISCLRNQIDALAKMGRTYEKDLESYKSQIAMEVQAKHEAVSKECSLRERLNAAICLSNGMKAERDDLREYLSLKEAEILGLRNTVVFLEGAAIGGKNRYEELNGQVESGLTDRSVVVEERYLVMERKIGQQALEIDGLRETIQRYSAALDKERSHRGKTLATKPADDADYADLRE